MSSVLASINNSPAPRGVPRQGSTTSAISANEDIVALLQQISESAEESELDNGLFDFEESSDEPENLEDLVAKLPGGMNGNPESGSAAYNPVSSPMPARSGQPVMNAFDIAGKVTTPQGRFSVDDDLIESPEGDMEENNTGSTSVKFKKYIIAGAAILLVIILAVVIINVIKGKSKEPDLPAQSDETKNVLQSSQTFYADQLTLTDDQTYQDSMTIEKYIVLDQDACLFVFRGYAENARAFVTAYVDADTYNRYKTGARVPILYECISIDDKDYYMKVRLNV